MVNEAWLRAISMLLVEASKPTPDNLLKEKILAVSLIGGNRLVAYFFLQTRGQETEVDL